MTKKPSRAQISADRAANWKKFRITLDVLAKDATMAKSFAAIMIGEPDPNMKVDLVSVVPIERAQVTVVHTDGGCDLKRGGTGAWACVIQHPDGRREELVGGDVGTTNNRMEMEAVLQALTALSPGPPVHVVCDSQYVIKGVTEWRQGWVSRGWVNALNKPVKNREIWEKLYALWDKHNVRFEHVRGHSGVVENERCDQLCTEEIRRRLSKNSSDGT